MSFLYSFGSFVQFLVKQIWGGIDSTHHHSNEGGGGKHYFSVQIWPFHMITSKLILGEIDPPHSFQRGVVGGQA